MTYYRCEGSLQTIPFVDLGGRNQILAPICYFLCRGEPGFPVSHSGSTWRDHSSLQEGLPRRQWALSPVAPSVPRDWLVFNPQLHYGIRYRRYWVETKGCGEQPGDYPGIGRCRPSCPLSWTLPLLNATFPPACCFHRSTWLTNCCIWRLQAC